MNKPFFVNHLGEFYFIKENNEIILRLEGSSRLEATVMVEELAESIKQIIQVMTVVNEVPNNEAL